jgi:uncharacterized protein
MAQVEPDVIASVQRFLAVVGLRRHVDAAYLYGSQAVGSARPWSDIDVAVVSPDFSEDLFQERLELMYVAAAIDDRIEPYPFTIERFNLNNPLVSEIRRTGIRLA